MGLFDIFFPNEAKNRKSRDYRTEHKKANRRFQEAYKAGQETLKDSVAARSLESNLADLYNADKKTPLEKRTSDLEDYRGEVLRDLVHNYQRGNLNEISAAIDGLANSEFFARSFLYKPRSQRRKEFKGRADSDLEPLEETEIAHYKITFDPEYLVDSARQLVDLAKKAYWGAQHQKDLGFGQPKDHEIYKVNLELGKKVYNLLSRTAQYLVGRSSERGYESLSGEQKKALAEVTELLADIKPEKFSKTLGTLSILGLVSGALFISTKITGNVIGISNSSSSLIGLILLITGIIFGLFWINKKKNKKSSPKIKKSRKNKK